MATHSIRLHPRDYEELVASNRDFNVQFNNAGFAPGDCLHFIETELCGIGETGRMMARTITHVIERSDDLPLYVRHGLKRGYCILGFQR